MVQGNTLHLDDAGGPSGVAIGNLGSFDDDRVKVLLKFCSIAKHATGIQGRNGLAQCQSQ